MAGIYLHIPFCAQACHYCNFHFSTTFHSYRKEMIDAICKELTIRKEVFDNQSVATIYFGGGTPSLLTNSEIDQLFDAITRNYNLGDLKEVTIEANPEDISMDLLKHWRGKGINRISLGVQSFFDDDLQQMNRIHTAMQAEHAIRMIQEVGFKNFSIDFMFALPLLSNEQLIKNLERAIAFNVPHISCYNLTVKEQTALLELIKRGKIEELSEDKSIQQFELIMGKLADHRYLQYEISNYALEGYKSIHNSAYWEQRPYLGVGPSAHSFYKNSRTHNVRNNKKYINAVQTGSPFYDVEELSERDFFNEFIMTRLRTSKGINIRELELLFPKYVRAFKDKTSDFLRGGQLAFFGDEYRLTKAGKMVADYVASEFFEV
ncbi:MAG: coproporphyrinogen III oxidase [Flavobacteriales bacterium]|nr:coproporphyrinogen III oxidase [Flavobacteriales bacterium]